MLDTNKTWDLLVVGGGNAALCAALMAREAGCSVILLEGAPKPYRGGNSRHTRNLRCMHEEPQDILLETYPEEEYWQDLLKVTGGLTNEHLARMMLKHTSSCRPWMVKHGVRFQPPLGGTLHLSRTNAFFLGGGKALVNAFYDSAERLGVSIHYEAKVTDIEIDGDTFKSATFTHGGATHQVRAKAVVVACGGFQANLEWLEEAWGAAAKNFLVRGTPYNRGDILKVLLAKGAKQISDPLQGHCVAIDARSPKYDGGIITRVDAVSLGIVVNKNAQRFYDEGEDFWPKRYAIWGRLVAGQPDQIGYSIVDAKVMGKFMPPVYPPVRAKTLRELAQKLEIDPDALEKTVAEFNAAIRPGGTFDHTIQDDCATIELTPPKTHWAQKIDTAPYFGYPLRPGITFTYLGVTVDDKSRMILQDDKPCKNIFAAGEIMAGNVLGKGYLAGIGMSIGTVFGRIAGEEAAKHVRG
jgi:tricarballylate dehydrogenase